MPWHTDSCWRVTTVLHSDRLRIQYRHHPGGDIDVAVSPGLAEWSEPSDRVHRTVNIDSSICEEVAVFLLLNPVGDPQPERSDHAAWGVRECRCAGRPSVRGPVRPVAMPGAIRSGVLAGLTLLPLGCSPSPAPAPMANTTDTLTQLERDLADAWVAHDLAFVEQLLVDDWTVTDISGQVLTKRQVIDDPDRVIESMTVDDLRVRDLCETAAVTGRTRASGSYAGTPVSVELRFTDVFARRNGRWQAIVSHGTMVPQ